MFRRVIQCSPQTGSDRSFYNISNNRDLTLIG